VIADATANHCKLTQPHTPAVRSHRNCYANERRPLACGGRHLFCNQILQHGVI
jgi:hypothetical protein